MCNQWVIKVKWLLTCLPASVLYMVRIFIVRFYLDNINNNVMKDLYFLFNRKKKVTKKVPG